MLGQPVAKRSGVPECQRSTLFLGHVRRNTGSGARLEDGAFRRPPPGWGAKGRESRKSSPGPRCRRNRILGGCRPLNPVPAAMQSAMFSKAKAPGGPRRRSRRQGSINAFALGDGLHAGGGRKMSFKVMWMRGPLTMGSEAFDDPRRRHPPRQRPASRDAEPVRRHRGQDRRPPRHAPLPALAEPHLGGRR
jgi:hypothetical protein